jgi:hypothetical protein
MQWLARSPLHDLLSLIVKFVRVMCKEVTALPSKFKMLLIHEWAILPIYDVSRMHLRSMKKLWFISARCLDTVYTLVCVKLT